jgi:hypothetical protein
LDEWTQTDGEHVGRESWREGDKRKRVGVKKWGSKNEADNAGALILKKNLLLRKQHPTYLMTHLFHVQGKGSVVSGVWPSVRPSVLPHGNT